MIEDELTQIIHLLKTFFGSDCSPANIVSRYEDRKRRLDDYLKAQLTATDHTATTTTYRNCLLACRSLFADCEFDGLMRSLGQGLPADPDTQHVLYQYLTRFDFYNDIANNFNWLVDEQATGTDEPLKPTVTVSINLLAPVDEIMSEVELLIKDKQQQIRQEFGSTCNLFDHPRAADGRKHKVNLSALHTALIDFDDIRQSRTLFDVARDRYPFPSEDAPDAVWNNRNRQRDTEARNLSNKKHRTQQQIKAARALTYPPSELSTKSPSKKK